MRSPVPMYNNVLISEMSYLNFCILRYYMHSKILMIGFMVSLFLGFPSLSAAAKKGRPNIIYICIDQQHAGMMSCAGNKWLKTPAMDYIAQNGIRFTRAYTTNPVCSPARVSLMTGRFAGVFLDKEGNQVRENAGSMVIPRISDEVKNTTIPAFLLKANYELVYGGKRDLPSPLDPTILGFKDLGGDGREKLAESVAQYIKLKHQNPFFMMVSLINPHDICYMAIRDFANTELEKRIVTNGVVPCNTLDKALQMPLGVDEKEFFAKYCPTLPANYEPQKDEPEAIKSLIERRNFRKEARDKYTDDRWRLHRWAYCRLTELVDQQVQTILDALKSSGQEENTLVIFSSDHGDMDGAHRMEHKTALYEESVNIPFLAMWKGHFPAGKVDDHHLVSNGLDLLPTVCDYAGIKGVADPRGRSLRTLFEGGEIDWRKTLGVETEIGRMVVDQEKFKYIKYDAVGIEEQLFDLSQTPLEMMPVTNHPKYQEKLAHLRKVFLSEWFPGY
jgi:arylsulfatase A-like enzyme